MYTIENEAGEHVGRGGRNGARVVYHSLESAQAGLDRLNRIRKKRPENIPAGLRIYAWTRGEPVE